MRRLSLTLLWLVTDMLLFCAAFALAYGIRVGWVLSTNFPFDLYMTVAAMTAPLWLVILVASRMFGLTRNQRSVRALGLIIYATIVGVALFALIYFFFFDLFFSRLLLVIAFTLTTVFVWGWHLLCEQILRRALHSKHPAFPTLILGANREAGRLIVSLKRFRSPLKPVVIIDARTKERNLHGVPVAGRLHKLEETLRSYHITHVIQCSELEQSLNVVTLCRALGITYMLLPSVLGIVEGDERVDMLEGHPVTVVDAKASKWGWFFR